MPLTTRLEIDDQTNGSNNNTWGDVTDSNLQILEQAIAGVTSISTTGGATTLTSSQNRFPIIVITGTLVSNATINVRAAEKNWQFINSTTGAFTVTVKTPSGSGQTIGQGESRRFYCDGTNVLNAPNGNAIADVTGLQAALNAKSNLAGGNTFSGDQIINGAVRIDGAFPNYQWYPTTGAANQRAFRVQADNGNFTVIGIDDSGNQVNFPFSVRWGAETVIPNNVLVAATQNFYFSGRVFGYGAGGINGIIGHQQNSGGAAFVASVADATADLTYFGYSPNGAFNATGAVKTGSITTNGTTTSYNTTSDYRLKEDVVPMSGALAKIAALNPVTYKWKSNGSAAQGFIAHELQAVVPDAVVGEKDAVDDGGKPLYQGIDQSKLVPLLTAALQEAVAKIGALDTRIAALEA
jgi:hypothetical protein